MDTRGEYLDEYERCMTVSDVHLYNVMGMGVALIYDYKKKRKEDICPRDRMVGSIAVSGIFPRSYPFRIIKLWCKFKLARQLTVDDVGRNRHHRHGMGGAQWLAGKRVGADRRSHGPHQNREVLVALGKQKLLDRYFAVGDGPLHSGVIGPIPRRIVSPPSTVDTLSVSPGKTCGAPAASSKTVRAFSSLSVLRLILGRFAQDMIPDLSSLSSSVGLGPRFHFDGDDETTDGDVWCIWLPLAELRMYTAGNERVRSWEP